LPPFCHHYWPFGNNQAFCVGLLSIRRKIISTFATACLGRMLNYALNTAALQATAFNYQRKFKKIITHLSIYHL
jgi:hypothetical protein